uniref:PP1-binding domain-containing protein n=1 Tax=Falco tinnunculus TaxID=100819 RepID=A0A8C4UWA3_FALTI
MMLLIKVLHVQQVAEMELLHQQTPGSKSLHVSDDAEFEEKNANEIKQSTEENTSKALPIKLQTPKSSCRIHQIITKKNEKSPFTKLYEKLKYEIQVKNFLYNGNASQEAAKEDVDKYLLSTPTPRRKSSQSHFISPTRETSGMNPVNNGTPTTRRRVSSKHKSLSEISAETEREDSVSRNDSLKQLPLAEDKCLKQRQNSKQHTPGKPVEEVVLKEICDQANSVNSKEGHSETPASLSKSRSPRRNNRQNDKLSNKSVHLETLASEELMSELTSPASQKPDSGRRRSRWRTSVLLTEKVLEADAVREHHKTADGKDKATEEELVTKEYHQKQDLEDASVIRPRRLPSMRRSSGSVTVLKDNEAVSEVNISGLLPGEESGKTKRVSRKRKSGDLLLQPLGNRKRVSFGGQLSPELFDKSLPANSPLKKGATPARLSLPMGNSPRAVLKKAQGLKCFAAQELSEHWQKEKMSPKNLPAQKSPAASSLASGKATSRFTSGSPEPYTKGRFSVSHITALLPIAEEKDAVAEDMNTKEKTGAWVKTSKSSDVNQDDKTFLTATPEKLTSAQFASKITPMKSRSGALAVINAKRRSGASTANLLVAKSWAEVVKLGVVRPQSKTRKKSVRKGRPLKKKTQSPKTPERKIKDHFSTGHAESPATIVVGRAYCTTVRAAGQVPKVVKNPILKPNMNMDESFTGMTEMFQTPENKSGKMLPLATVQKTDFTPTCTAVDTSELHTPEESGEMMVSPLNSSDGSEQKQDSPGISSFLRGESLKSMFDAISTKTEKRKSMLEESVSVDNLSIIPEKEASRVKSGGKRRTSKQKLKPIEAMSDIKQLLRTPEQSSEPVEALSGIRQLMRTPKQKSEPVEALSGIKQLMRTPKQELETVTDKITEERLLKAPVQERGAVKDVAGVTLIKKSPKVKYQPVEDMIGVSRIFKTPKEKVEPVEDMFGISRLLKTPREKHQPVDDFVGLQRLMAEPRGRCSDSELDYVGVTEMFDIPEEIKTKSVSVTDSKQEGTAPLCTNSSHKYDVLDNERNIPQGKDSRQKESTREDQTTQILTRGRSRKTTQPTSAKQCEKDSNLKELQSLGKKNTQEEMGEISNSTSGAKNEGRRTRTNSLIQEEIVSKHPLQEKVVVVQFVESHGATQGPGKGKKENPKEIRHPSENLESCSKDSSVLQKEPDNMKQALQECSINDVLSTEDDPAIKTADVSRNIQNESCQLQTGLIKGENKFSEGGVEDSEGMFLLPGKRSKRVKEKENTEPVVLPKRGRAKNSEVKQAFSEDLHETARKLRSDLSVKMIKTDEQAFDKDTETATAEESENGSKHEIKITGKRVKSLRSARKHSVEVKADVCGMALENIQNIQKNEETETDTEIQSHVKNKIKVSQGDETDNAQESTTEASQRLKAESPGEINKMPATALNLEANRSAVQGTNRTRNRRGKKDSLEKKADEFAKDVNNLEIMTPILKSEMEMDKSLKDYLGFVCGKNTCQVMKDQNSPAATSVPAANSDSLALSPEKRTRNEHRILEAKQTEILQENQAQKNGMACRRGRSRKVNFELEVSSRAVGGKRSLPGNDKGKTYKGGQHETSECPSSQVRRSRRKQVDSVPQITCSGFVEKQTLIADHSKVEAFVKEQDSALEATPSSMEDNPLRRGKRREVAAASQTSRSLSIRKRHGLLEGDDKKMTVREDQNPALGNKTSQTKANASARGKRKTIDPATEEKRSSLRRKRGLSETESKEEGANEAQNMSLETVSCAKEKPLGRGRRKETALTSHTTNYISLRGKRGLPTDNGRVEVSKEGVPLENLSSSVKENRLRTGRRNEIALLLEASNCTIQGKQDLSKESGRNNNYRKAKNLVLGSSASQEKNDLSKRNSRQTTTSPAVSSISLRGLPEDGKNETPEEQENVLLEGAPCARVNPSRADKKKTISSKSEETSSAFLREKPGLLEGRGQRKILEDENTSLENNSSQGKTRQLRNRREKVEFKSEAATSASVCKEGDLPENSNTLETQNVCLTSTGSEKNNQSGKGKEVNPIQQATSTSRRRKCQLPEDDLASKKLKSENDEDRPLQTGKRNKTKEDVRVTQAAGGTDRKTRSSARTRK